MKAAIVSSVELARADTLSARDYFDPARRVRAYRSRHLIEPVKPDPDKPIRCAVDGIAVRPVRGGQWRHDPAEVEELVRQAPTAGTFLDR